ncbi:MAG: hypothetical protein ACOYT9_02675 [Patescibacteria group bacterium]
MVLEIISIIISVISLGVSLFAFRESSITRKSQKQPLLVLESAFDELVIKNIGNAPAFNITVLAKNISMDKEPRVFDMQWAYSYVLPGETTSQSAPIPVGDFEMLEVTIKYVSIYKEKHQVIYEVQQNLRGEGRTIQLKKTSII